MCWKQFGFWILATALVSGEVAAQGPTSSTMFQQRVVGFIKVSLVGGRVAGNSSNGAWMFGTSKQVSSDGPVHEEVSLNGNGATGSITYSYRRNGDQAGQGSDPRVEFGVEIGSEGRFVLRYTDKDHPQSYFNLSQASGQPISLSLPPSDKPRVLQAPTLWHLLIINGDDCRKQFLPMLESLRSGWRLGPTVQTVEDELVKMAALSRKLDRKQWEEWINQLGDPVCARRERADHHLREVGPAVLGYLNRLNTSQLDAEQRARVRRIIRVLSTPSGEDTPEHVAAMLSEDPLVWLALLARPEESTRRAAVQQLAVLLNVPIAIDPKADPATQAKAREELRLQIEKPAATADKASK